MAISNNKSGSQAFKRAVSQAAKTTPYQIKGTWVTKASDAKPLETKKVITIKK